MSYLIRNTHLIDPINNFDEITDILIENSKISKIGKGISSDKAVIINGDGLFSLPAAGKV